MYKKIYMIFSLFKKVLHNLSKIILLISHKRSNNLHLVENNFSLSETQIRKIKIHRTKHNNQISIFKEFIHISKIKRLQNLTQNLEGKKK